MEQIKELIDYYLTFKNVYLVKNTLVKIVSLTTKDNYA
ncbi:hypothetical protein SAMN05216503_1832 [Polaribacter sp. KT25b]|nr:hypothetical protein SAMN05216503_1832 [Polaribacter sp. KT25b]